LPEAHHRDELLKPLAQTARRAALQQEQIAHCSVAKPEPCGAQRHLNAGEPEHAASRLQQEPGNHKGKRITSGVERSDTNNDERPPGNRAAFLSRENSSNGGSKTIRTFWKKSYGPLKRSVKEFFENKCLCFQ
jgi:hypothetical protein